MQNFDEGIVLEEGGEEPLAESGAVFRLQSFLLLLIFVLPMLLTIIKVLTGLNSESISPPVTPTPTLSGLGHF